MIFLSEFRHKLLVKLLELVHGRLLSRPTDDQTLRVSRGGLGDDMEMDMVDLLVSDTTVVLK